MFHTENIKGCNSLFDHSSMAIFILSDKHMCVLIHNFPTFAKAVLQVLTVCIVVNGENTYS